MKRYYFVFCQDHLLLERKPDGTCTIPLQEEPPTEVKPWTTVLNVSPLDDVEVKAYTASTPPSATIRSTPCAPCGRATTSCPSRSI